MRSRRRYRIKWRRREWSRLMESSIRITQVNLLYSNMKNKNNNKIISSMKYLTLIMITIKNRIIIRVRKNIE